MKILHILEQMDFLLFHIKILLQSCIPYAPHLYCGPVIGAANIQISTCSPNFLILESIKKWEDLYSDLLIKPIKWQNGYIIPPTEPGLGIELNEEVAMKYPYKDSKLHLEMKE